MKWCEFCGGVIGRECFNPQECEWIVQQELQRYNEEQEQEFYEAQYLDYLEEQARLEINQNEQER